MYVFVKLVGTFKDSDGVKKISGDFSFDSLWL